MTETVFRCGECGNQIEDVDVPTIPAGEGSKGRVTFRVEPVCNHGLPYSMMRVPITDHTPPRSPKKVPR